jgi:hypothetical protein
MECVLMKVEKRMVEESAKDQSAASELFFRAIKRAARAFRDSENKGCDESSIKAIEAVRKKQEEHEEHRRRISEKIKNGARLSRDL